MSSSFSGLSIVVKGLFAQQAAMNVTGHNISNVNTDGYSRQRAVLETTTPEAVGSWGMLGTGVTVQQIERLRNSFLDVKFWGENMVLGEWEARSDILSQIEAVFNEPSDAGLNTVIDSFFSSLQELAKDPGSLTVRAL
ncbi:MAG: flagellar basal body protein, partial [Bacillota bacterium]|nr:flagellar basal body protein [Bacillota bacterium]